MTSLEETTVCASYRLRRAARMVGRLYDNKLKTVGLRNTQFTILGALRIEEARPIGELAETLGTEATTLTRNLEVMKRHGWVEDLPEADGRVRQVGITEAGQQKFEEALPLWTAAHKQALSGLNGPDWFQMVQKLKQIEENCDM